MVANCHPSHSLVAFQGYKFCRNALQRVHPYSISQCLHMDAKSLKSISFLSINFYLRRMWTVGSLQRGNAHSRIYLIFCLSGRNKDFWKYWGRLMGI